MVATSFALSGHPEMLYACCRLSTLATRIATHLPPEPGDRKTSNISLSRGEEGPYPFASLTRETACNSDRGPHPRSLEVPWQLIIIGLSSYGGSQDKHNHFMFMSSLIITSALLKAETCLSLFMD